MAITKKATTPVKTVDQLEADKAKNEKIAAYIAGADTKPAAKQIKMIGKKAIISVSYFMKIKDSLYL